VYAKLFFAENRNSACGLSRLAGENPKASEDLAKQPMMMVFLRGPLDFHCHNLSTAMEIRFL